MIMPDAEKYILRIRKMVGSNIYIIVPDTRFYQELLNKMKDEYLILKIQNMDLTKYGRKIETF